MELWISIRVHREEKYPHSKNERGIGKKFAQKHPKTVEGPNPFIQVRRQMNRVMETEEVLPFKVTFKLQKKSEN